MKKTQLKNIRLSNKKYQAEQHWLSGLMFNIGTLCNLILLPIITIIGNFITEKKQIPKLHGQQSIKLMDQW